MRRIPYGSHVFDTRVPTRGHKSGCNWQQVHSPRNYHSMESIVQNMCKLADDSDFQFYKRTITPRFPEQNSLNSTSTQGGGGQCGQCLEIFSPSGRNPALALIIYRADQKGPNPNPIPSIRVVPPKSFISKPSEMPAGLDTKRGIIKLN